MAKSKKTAGNQPGDEESPGFENALAELQTIVDELESGALGLEASMQRFETGVRLLRGCYTILEEAEQKIEVLTGFDNEGNPQMAPFDATSTVEQTKQKAGRRKRSKTGGKTRKKEPAENDANKNDTEEESEETLF